MLCQLVAVVAAAMVFVCAVAFVGGATQVTLPTGAPLPKEFKVVAAGVQSRGRDQVVSFSGTTGKDAVHVHVRQVLPRQLHHHMPQLQGFL